MAERVSLSPYIYIYIYGSSVKGTWRESFLAGDCGR
jgi:predicted nucleotidyltransferase